MRVAVAQARLSEGGRSRNLSAVTRAISHASQLDPVPDLVILPGNCDGNPAEAENVLVSGSRPITAAMCQGFVETMATLAREWGVWVAAGHQWPCDGQPGWAYTLFDSDGDVCLRYERPDRGNAGITQSNTALGKVAIVDTLTAAHAIEQPLDLIIVPTGPDASSCPQPSKLAEEAKAYVCLASCCQTAAQTPSCIYNRNGELMAKAESDKPQVVSAQLDVVVVPPATGTNMERIGNLE